jgi:pimeloyl-ACP methyl ester carboxylesterase
MAGGTLLLSALRPSIPVADGLVLRGELTYPRRRGGAKFPLAVLAHQYPSTRDSYAPLCADLHAQGVATLAFDMRGQGESIWSPDGARVAPTPEEPTMAAFGAAFMASAAELGFAHIADDIVRVASWGLNQNFIDSTRLLLVGASVGGTGVLLAAPRLSPVLRGVLTFGAAGAGVHSDDAMDRIRTHCESLNVPMLLTTSERDPFDGASNARAWGRGLPHVTARVVPDADHAMAISFAVRADERAFAQKVMAASGRARSSPARGRRRDFAALRFPGDPPTDGARGPAAGQNSRLRISLKKRSRSTSSSSSLRRCGSVRSN